MAMGRLRRLALRADAAQQRHPGLALPAAVIRKFADDRAGGLAALIAYYAFFSLFPLMLVAVTVTSYILHGNEQLQNRIVDSMLVNLPIIGTQIRGGIHSINGSMFALTVGIAGALWAGMGVLASVESALDDIWDVPRRERASMIPRLIRGAIVLVALGAAVLVAALTAGISTAMSSVPAAVIAWSIAAALNVGTMMIIFRVLTAAEARWRRCVAGCHTRRCAVDGAPGARRIHRGQADLRGKRRLRRLRRGDRTVVMAVPRRTDHRARCRVERRPAKGSVASLLDPAARPPGRRTGDAIASPRGRD